MDKIMKEDIYFLFCSKKCCFFALVIILRIIVSLYTTIGFFSTGILLDLCVLFFIVTIVAHFLKNEKGINAFYIIFGAIIVIFVTIDIIYYDYFNIIVSKQAIGGISWLTNGNLSNFGLTIPNIVYITIFTFILYVYGILKTHHSYEYNNPFLIICFVLFLVPIFIYSFHSIRYNFELFDSKREYYNSETYFYKEIYNREVFSTKYGFYTYHFLDIISVSELYDDDDYDEAVSYMDDIVYDKPTNEYTDEYNGYNLVTVLAETLETRFIDPELTPTLYELYNSSIVLDNYYVPAFQQGATCNSEFMSLTGISAITATDWSSNYCETYVDNTYPYSLPNQLNENGYDTYYFHSGDGWFYNRSLGNGKGVIPNMGFETYKFKEDISSVNEDFDFHYDDQLIDFFDEYVDFDELFYANVLTFSMHGGYEMNMEYDTLHFQDNRPLVDSIYSDSDLDDEVIVFMEKMVYFDRFIEVLINKLKEEGVYDNTLLIIYPDHYPYMMDSDVYHDYVNIESNSYEVANQRLLIHDGSGEYISIDNEGSTMDLTPTILNMLIGSDGVYNKYFGRDLMDGNNPVIFPDMSVLYDGNYIAINEEYIGDEASKPDMEIILEDKIYLIEMIKKILATDYYKIRY